MVRTLKWAPRERTVQEELQRGIHLYPVQCLEKFQPLSWCINTGKHPVGTVKHPVGAVEVCQSLGLVKYPHRPMCLSSRFWMAVEPLGGRDLLRKWTTAGEPWSFMLGPTRCVLPAS